MNRRREIIQTTGRCAALPPGPGSDAAANTADIGDALAPRQRGRGLPLALRLRLVAVRLEAGLRETPQRFIPAAAFVSRLEIHTKRQFLHFLVAEALAEAVSAADCSGQVLDLLTAAKEVLANNENGRAVRRDAVVAEIRAAAPPLRRRRSIHCHGAVTSDRRLLLLRAVMPPAEEDAFAPHALLWAIAYAMAYYDRDHFVMQGAHLAQRVRLLASWVEAEMARAADPTARRR